MSMEFVEVELVETEKRQAVVNLAHVVSLVPPADESGIWNLQLVAGGLALPDAAGEALYEMLRKWERSKS